MISNVNDDTAANFDSELQEACFLIVENPRHEGDDMVVDAIGFLGLEWRMTIQNYKSKKGPLQHHTTISVNSWAAVYTELDNVDKDVRTVAAGLHEQIPALPF